MNFEKKVIIISGASSGIGFGCAKELLDAGAFVFGIDLNESVCEHTNYKHIIADVRDEKNIINAIDLIDGVHKKIDGLVNCAGINSCKKPFYDMEKDEWDKVLSINLTGTFLLSKYASKKMIGQKSGKIVNISCIRTKIFKKNMAEYSASKGGIVALTSSMAMDLAPYNIQVNSVAPGLTYTSEIKRIFEKHPELETEYTNLMPQHRLAQPEDIAKPILFLLSDNSDYITGQTIFVDGGISIAK
ncbi:MAG: SDR family oxidoreductase [Fibrobacteraceae bacterium]|nr:SDR family oxidoreductase [Fibrobacteraceae bacterium]